MGINKRIHDILYPQMLEIYESDMCLRCGKLPKQGSQNIIHHVNGDDTDNRLSNVCFLCPSCNKLKKLQKKNLPVNTQSYQISASHKKALEAEPSFRRWLLGKILSNNGHYPIDFVIKEGAFETNISTITAQRYIDKLTDHPSSPYLLGPGPNGEEVYLRNKAPTDIDYL